MKVLALYLAGVAVGLVICGYQRRPLIAVGGDPATVAIVFGWPVMLPMILAGLTVWTFFKGFYLLGGAIRSIFSPRQTGGRS